MTMLHRHKGRRPRKILQRNVLMWQKTVYRKMVVYMTKVTKGRVSSLMKWKNVYDDGDF